MAAMTGTALAVASLAAAAYSANEQRKAGKAAKRSANETAAAQTAAAKENAAMELKEANEEARRMGVAQKSQLSEAKARAGASGVRTTGSQLGFLERLEENQGKELDWLKKSGASRADFIKRTGAIQAGMTRSSGSSAYSQGKIGSMDSLIGGAGQAYSYWNT